MIEGLAAEVGIEIPGADKASSEQLIRHASRIGELLRRRRDGELAGALRRVLSASMGEAMPAQTTALARLDWPLMITTNYDDLLRRAYNRRLEDDARQRLATASGQTDIEVERVVVAGRNARDCQQVSSSLDASTGPILWALQGFLASDGEPPLEDEIVLGHEEYRRATHAQPHFRRVFAEVFRRRNFLFLGSGLAEPYFLDLFGEVIEFFGPNPAPHYALACDDLDDDFLSSRYNILVIRYGKYGELPDLLGGLHKAASGDAPRQRYWGFHDRGLHSSIEDPDLGGSPIGELSIVTAPLPVPKQGRRECAVLSAGLLQAGSLYLSESMKNIVSAAARSRLNGRTGVRIPEGPVFFDLADAGGFAAIAAWKDYRTRDLRTIRPGVVHALAWAVAKGFDTVHMALIGAGHTRHFHPRFSLAEIIRGFRDWRGAQAPGQTAVRLIVHVVDTAAVRTLDAGSLDVLELLSARDLRFWLEILDGDRVERALLFRDEDEQVSALAEQYGVDGDDWAVEADPQPVTGGLETVEISRASLRRLGVLPGATLRFTRRSCCRPQFVGTPG